MNRIGSLFIALVVCGVFSGTALADIKRGQSLHDENCISCHARMMGGKGLGIYTRPNRRIETLDGLGMQVNRCKDSLGFDWPEDQIDDVVDYLNTNFYKFEE